MLVFLVPDRLKLQLLITKDHLMKNVDFKNSLVILGNKIELWYENSINIIPNLVAAFLVLLIFIVIGKIIKKLSGRLLPKITKNKSVINLLQTMIYAFIMLLGLFVSLEILNLEKTVTSILAGAGVIGLALGFAFQEIASNFVSGVFIAFRRPYKLEDIVEIDDYFGKVTDINLRTTSITTFQGLEVLIPNKYMFTKPFINLTTTPHRRIDIAVGVSYSDDLEKVEKVTKEALQEINERVKDRPIEVYFNEFGASSINLSARVWINYPKNQAYLRATHEAIILIKKAFDKNKISIPFPIRTLDVNGGTLNEVKDKFNNM